MILPQDSIANSLFNTDKKIKREYMNYEIDGGDTINVYLSNNSNIQFVTESSTIPLMADGKINPALLE